MKVGANSVLFRDFDLDTTFKHLKMAGYDGIEISAITGQDPHLVPDRWQDVAEEIKQLSKTYELELLAMEQQLRDPTYYGKSDASGCGNWYPHH